MLGGGGETGSRAVERNQKQMVLWWGSRAGKVPTVALAVPTGHWGIWGNGLGEAPGVGGRALLGTRSLTLTPACLPGQRWHPGVSGAVCWSGSSRTAGTNGAQAQTARRTTSPLGPPTVSAHAARMLCLMVSLRNSCPEGASSLHLGLSRTQAGPKGARDQEPGLLLSHLPFLTQSLPALTVQSLPSRCSVAPCP